MRLNVTDHQLETMIKSQKSLYDISSKLEEYFPSKTILSLKLSEEIMPRKDEYSR